MLRRDGVVEVIFWAIEDLNQQLPEKDRLEKSLETVLFGKAGKLDSLGFVNLIVAVEQRIQEETGQAIALADERAMSQKESPFRTVDTLANYIMSILDDASAG